MQLVWLRVHSSELGVPNGVHQVDIQLVHVVQSDCLGLDRTMMIFVHAHLQALLARDPPSDAVPWAAASCESIFADCCAELQLAIAAGSSSQCNIRSLEDGSSIPTQWSLEAKTVQQWLLSGPLQSSTPVAFSSARKYVHPPRSHLRRDTCLLYTSPSPRD